MKICTACENEKELVEFGRNASCRGGFSTRCKSCDNAYLRGYYRRNVKKRMLLGARDRAVKQGLPFDLKETDFEVPEFCPVLGLKLVISNKRGGTDSSPSLDRIVPALGYTPGNVVVISNRANRIKSNCDPEDIMAVGEWLKKMLE